MSSGDAYILIALCGFLLGLFGLVKICVTPIVKRLKKIQDEKAASSK